MSRKCYVSYFHQRNQREPLSIETEIDPTEDDLRPLPIEKLIEVEVDGPRWIILLRVTLLEKTKNGLRKFF